MNKEKLKLFGVIFSLLFITIPVNGLGQEKQENKKPQMPFEEEYKIAQSYENIGEHKKALDIYQRLFKAVPDNRLFLDGIKRTMLFLKMYPELVEILEAQLEKNKDINLMGDLADIYYRWGKMEKAHEVWNEIIQTNPQQEFSYLVVSNLMVQNRLFNEGINVLLEGRKVLNNEDAFAINLGNLYYYRKDFEASTREFMGLLEKNDRMFNTVNSYLSRFPNDSTTYEEVAPVLLEKVQNAPKNPLYLRLLVNFYIRHKKYNSAFKTYRMLDTIQNSGGNEILLFADRLSAEKEYPMAVTVYSYFLENYPSHNLKAKARYGLAFSYENLYVSSEAGSNKNTLKAIEEYKTVIEKTPDKSLRADSHYRLGEIYFKLLFDLDQAIIHCTDITKLVPNTGAYLRAFVRLGDVYTSKGNLRKARENYRRVLRADPKLGPKFVEEARFNLAKLHYFEGKIDTTQILCDELLSNIPKNSELYNDIFEFSLFLRMNSGLDTNLVKDYAEAEFLLIQRKSYESLTLLKSLYDTYPDQSISDIIMFEIIRLNHQMQQYEEAVALLQKFTDKYPESVYTEKAHKMLSEIYENNLNKPALSLKKYEEFLVKYPGSIYSDEVRKRIRQLEREVSGK